MSRSGSGSFGNPGPPRLWMTLISYQYMSRRDQGRAVHRDALRAWRGCAVAAAAGGSAIGGASGCHRFPGSIGARCGTRGWSGAPGRQPANILLDVRKGRPDHPYLADFGISRRTHSLARLTGTGQFLGTVDYAAPEQIQGSPADGRADQYALACTLFELLSGEAPFRRDDPSAVIWSKMTEPPPLLTSQRADLPTAVNGVLAKALAKTPQGRYATCGEFTDALREALGLNFGMPGDPANRPAANGK